MKDDMVGAGVPAYRMLDVTSDAGAARATSCLGWWFVRVPLTPW
jgi:hypothetical protein